MIKKIRVKNFESHVDTVIDDLSPHLNTLTGVSNSGKSAIIRAIDLICYNQFDPRSVRTGCTNCEVEVETDRGKVRVIRGKENIWEVTDLSGKTETFTKIGKQILPQVTDVIGFGFAKLGDLEMRVNVMDQLESHFMLSGFDGEESTGSVRAQVVDEISGMSGIETLIRDVSLDSSRLTREINQLDDKSREISSQMHDRDVLMREESTLKDVKELLDIFDGNTEAVSILQRMVGDFTDALEKANGCESGLALIPDIETASGLLKNAEKNCERMKVVQSIHDESVRLVDDIGKCERELAIIPNVESALVMLKKAETGYSRVKSSSALNEEYCGVKRAMEETEATLRWEIPDTKKPEALLNRVGDIVNEIEWAQDLLTDYNKTKQELERLEKTIIPDTDAAISVLEKVNSIVGRIQSANAILSDDATGKSIVKMVKASIADVDEKLKQATIDLHEAMAGIDICPLTLKPVGKECLKEMTR